MKPRTTSKAKTAAEQAEDRLVFDRPISLQQYNATQKAWSELEHIHANINKAISTGGANPSDSAHKSSYHFSYGTKLKVNEFKSKFSPLFWNFIWYCKILRIDYDILLPYVKKIEQERSNIIN